MQHTRYDDIGVIQLPQKRSKPWQEWSKTRSPMRLVIKSCSWTKLCPAVDFSREWWGDWIRAHDVRRVSVVRWSRSCSSSSSVANDASVVSSSRSHLRCHGNYEMMQWRQVTSCCRRHRWAAEHSVSRQLNVLTLMMDIRRHIRSMMFWMILHYCQPCPTVHVYQTHNKSLLTVVANSILLLYHHRPLLWDKIDTVTVLRDKMYMWMHKKHQLYIPMWDVSGLRSYV